MPIQDILISIFIILGVISIFPMIIGFIVDNKVLKNISFVTIIIFNLTVFGVLWMNK